MGNSSSYKSFRDDKDAKAIHAEMQRNFKEKFASLIVLLSEDSQKLLHLLSTQFNIQQQYDICTEIENIVRYCNSAKDNHTHTVKTIEMTFSLDHTRLNINHVNSDKNCGVVMLPHVFLDTPWLTADGHDNKTTFSEKFKAYKKRNNL